MKNITSYHKVAICNAFVDNTWMNYRQERIQFIFQRIWCTLHRPDQSIWKPTCCAHNVVKLMHASWNGCHYCHTMEALPLWREFILSQSSVTTKKNTVRYSWHGLHLYLLRHLQFVTHYNMHVYKWINKLNNKNTRFLCLLIPQDCN